MEILAIAIALAGIVFLRLLDAAEKHERRHRKFANRCLELSDYDFEKRQWRV